MCPSYNTRRMAETAAYLVEQVFPQVPVRQWVLSLSKHLRYFLHHEPALIGPVLRIFLDAVEDRLKVSSLKGGRLRGSDLCPSLRLGVECQPPLSLCGHDGVFGAQGERVQFQEARLLCPADIAAVQRAARTRVLRLFARRGLIPAGGRGQDAATRGWLLSMP